MYYPIITVRVSPPNTAAEAPIEAEPTTGDQPVAPPSDEAIEPLAPGE